MKADRKKKGGKSKAVKGEGEAVKSEGEAAGKLLNDEEITSQHAIADDLDALPSDRRKRGRHNVRYPPRFRYRRAHDTAALLSLPLRSQCRRVLTTAAAFSLPPRSKCRRRPRAAPPTTLSL